jgi:hypothetical protein
MFCHARYSLLLSDLDCSENLGSSCRGGREHGHGVAQFLNPARQAFHLGLWLPPLKYA